MSVQAGGVAAGRVHVRPAETADREALSQMFERCTPETRYRRFHGPVRAIPERYLADALSGSAFHHALVACPNQEERHIVALASCRLTEEGAAELGILVEDAWHRHGVGTRLLRDLVTHARLTGLRVLEAQTLAEQAWVAGLLRPYGTCRLRSTRDGVMNLTVCLAR